MHITECSEATKAQLKNAAGKAERRILKNVRNLFNNSKYADFTIKCGDRQWPVHKAIICLHSDFFAAACKGPFQVHKVDDGDGIHKY